MPKMTHLQVTALRDHVKVVTGIKKLRYRKVEGLEGSGLPSGQPEEYENQHGISLQMDQSIEIDVTDAQLPAFQAAVDAGDIECIVTVIPVAATHQAMAPTKVEALADKKVASK